MVREVRNVPERRTNVSELGRREDKIMLAPGLWPVVIAVRTFLRATAASMDSVLGRLRDGSVHWLRPPRLADYSISNQYCWPLCNSTIPC